MREVAGGFSEPCRLDGTSNGAQDTSLCTSTAPESLFAYPLESNFSGARYALEAATDLQRNGASLTCAQCRISNACQVAAYFDPMPKPPLSTRCMHHFI